MPNRAPVCLPPELAPMPVVICVAPNGARRSKLDHEHLPLTCGELAADARQCMLAGATAIHLHIRDSYGRHSLNAEIYRESIDAIKKATDGNMVVQITTEACGVYTPEQQMAVVRDVRPEAASVAIRELIPDESTTEAARFFLWARERGIGLQYVVYDQDDLLKAVRLQQDGIIPHEQPHLLFVLGRYSKNLSSSPDDLLPFLSKVPADWPWSVCAFGRSEAACMRSAISRGGNCRVGFENNLSLPNGNMAAANAELVATVRRTILDSSRALGSILDARALYVG